MRPASTLLALAIAVWLASACFHLGRPRPTLDGVPGIAVPIIDAPTTRDAGIDRLYALRVFGDGGPRP